MRLSFVVFLLAFLVQAVFAAAPPVVGPECGTSINTEDKAKVEADFAVLREQAGAEAAEASQKTQAVSVYFHVVRKNRTTAGGNVRYTQILEQIQALNKAFSGKGLAFVPKGTTYTTNADWFDNAHHTNAQNDAMKKSLHEGGKGALNIYSVGFTNATPAGLAGYATFPWEYFAKPWNNGIVIRHDTMPGGSTPNYNTGITAVHEVGHWVGLYHTFGSNTCGGPGDYVADTPQEFSYTFGCPVGRDTCPGQGPDPIHNYMEYTYDSCRNQFTPGQVIRLQILTIYYYGYVF